MLTLTEIAGSRYLLYRGLTDAGFPAGKAALAVDVLLGPEPDEEMEPEAETSEPSEDDLADYREWCMDIDRRWEEERFEADGYVSDADVMTVLGCAG